MDIRTTILVSLFGLYIGYTEYKHREELQRSEKHQQTLLQAIEESSKRKVQIELDTSAVNSANLQLQQTINLLNSGLHSIPEVARIEYSNTLGELLTECTKRYTEVARSADQHTNDLRIYRGLKP